MVAYYFVDDPGSISSTHKAAQNSVTLDQEDPMPFSDLWAPGTHAYMKAKYLYNKIFLRIIKIRCCLFFLYSSGNYVFIFSAARYEEGESEAESITSFMDVSNPFHQLYDTVRSCRNNQGQLIAEPFFHLPSKKKYPDYYQQIKMPISLQQIR